MNLPVLCMYIYTYIKIFTFLFCEKVIQSISRSQLDSLWLASSFKNILINFDTVFFNSEHSSENSNVLYCFADTSQHYINWTNISKKLRSLRIISMAWYIVKCQRFMKIADYIRARMQYHIASRSNEWIAMFTKRWHLIMYQAMEIIRKSHSFFEENIHGKFKRRNYN